MDKFWKVFWCWEREVDHMVRISSRDLWARREPVGGAAPAADAAPAAPAALPDVEAGAAPAFPAAGVPADCPAVEAP